MDRPLLPDDELTVYGVRGHVSEKREFPAGFLGNWREEGYSYLFFHGAQDRFLSRLLEAEPNLELVDRFSMTYRQWQGGETEPIRAGRFVVQPPGPKKSSVSPGSLAITLDAGLVFGDGRHPTTRDCLMAVELACSVGDIDRVLDLGTGSGLLALAAAKLGCRVVVAVDLNLLAAQTAQRNVRLNDLSDTVAVVNARAEVVSQAAADLLIANIGYPVLHDILRSASFLQHKWFVFSGLQTAEARLVADRLAALGARVVRRWQSEGVWHTFLGFVPQSLKPARTGGQGRPEHVTTRR